MRNKALVTTIALGVGVSGAAANPAPTLPMPMLGSDTMYSLTRDLVTAAGLTANLDYQGTGSSAGGNAMSPAIAGQGPDGNQQIASQSRFLSSGECSFFGTNVGTGQQVALDGIGIFHDTTEGTSCRVVRYTGCMTVTEYNAPSLTGFTNSPASATAIDDGVGVAIADDDPATPGVQYCFTHWADALRIIYTGLANHNNTAPGVLPVDLAQPTGACAPLPSVPSTERNARRCNSDVRHTLVNNWSNIFDTVGGGGDGGCSDGLCAQLKHAWRRDDLSGTTDTFLSLIGAPGVGTAASPARVFCNGIENEDLDPVRRNCDAATSALNDTDTACSAVGMKFRNLPFDATTGHPSGASTTNAVSPPPANSVGDLGLVQAVTIAPTRVLRAVCPAGSPSSTCFDQSAAETCANSRYIQDPTKSCADANPAATYYNPQYDTDQCASAAIGGTFKLAPMPFAASVNMQRCPNGNVRSANRCLWPTQRATLPGGVANPKAGWWNCRTTRTNRSLPAAWANYDARQYNAWARNPVTGDLLSPDASFIVDHRFTTPGVYRKHMVFSAANRANHPACREPDSTDQIGCLVEADPCTIGFAGLTGEDDLATDFGTVAAADNEPMFLRAPLVGSPASASVELQPNVTDIQKLTNSCGSGFELRYPLARILWQNAAKGLLNVKNTVTANDGTTQLNTRECDFVKFVHTNPDLNGNTTGDADEAVLKNNFILLPAGAHKHFGCSANGPTPIAELPSTLCQ